MTRGFIGPSPHVPLSVSTREGPYDDCVTNCYNLISPLPKLSNVPCKSIITH